MDQIAHHDIYSDLCWIQCTDCERKFGNICGTSTIYNPVKHGYFQCPYLATEVQVVDRSTP